MTELDHNEMVERVFLTLCCRWCQTGYRASPAARCRRGCFHSECLQSSSRRHDSGCPPSPDTPVSTKLLFSHWPFPFRSPQRGEQLTNSLPSLCKSRICPTWRCSPLPWDHPSPAHRKHLMLKHATVMIILSARPNLPERLAVKLSRRLPLLHLAQAVVEQAGVVLHRVRLP